MLLLPVNLYTDYGGVDKLRNQNRGEAGIERAAAVDPYGIIREGRVERRHSQQERRRFDRRQAKQSTTLDTRDKHERRHQNRRQSELHHHLLNAAGRPEPVSSTQVLRRSVGLDVYV